MEDSYDDYDYYDYDDSHDDTLLLKKARKSGISYGKAGHEFAKQISWFGIGVGCVIFLIVIALMGFLVKALLL